MTKADLVEVVAVEIGLTRVDVSEVINCFLKAIKEHLKKGHNIEMRGFGHFRVNTRKAWLARNPATGKPIQVPARKVIHFKSSVNFKRFIAENGAKL